MTGIYRKEHKVTKISLYDGFGLDRIDEKNFMYYQNERNVFSENLKGDVGSFSLPVIFCPEVGLGQQH